MRSVLAQQDFIVTSFVLNIGFLHSTVPPFLHSRNPPFPKPSSPEFFHSRNPPFQNSSIPEILHSRNPPFPKSSIPEVLHSRNPPFPKSSIPEPPVPEILHPRTPPFPKPSIPEPTRSRNPPPPKPSAPKILHCRITLSFLLYSIPRTCSCQSAVTNEDSRMQVWEWRSRNAESGMKVRDEGSRMEVLERRIYGMQHGEHRHHGIRLHTASSCEPSAIFQTYKH